MRGELNLLINLSGTCSVESQTLMGHPQRVWPITRAYHLLPITLQGFFIVIWASGGRDTLPLLMFHLGAEESESR